MSTFNVLGIGKAVSGAANTATPLVARSQGANRVDIQALATNTGTVVVGDTSVKSDGTTGGIRLSAGDVYSIELLVDILPINFATTILGEGVSFVFWIGDRN